MALDQPSQRSKTPAIAEVTAQEAPSTPKARKRRSVSPIVIPVNGLPPRVTKPVNRQRRSPSCSTTAPAEDFLSNENLLEILILRQQRLRAKIEKDQAASDRYRTRIRSLNHAVSELRQKKEELERNLKAADDATEQVSQDNESLRGQLEGSVGRYRKIKDFARTMARDLKALKQNADNQKLAAAELKEELSTGQDEARAAVSGAQTLVKKHARDIASVRQETNAVFGKLLESRTERDEKSARLEDEIRKNRRLETYITGLQTVQQQYNRAAKEGDQQIQTALSKITQHFGSRKQSYKPSPKLLQH